MHIFGHTLPPTLYNSISKDVVWSSNLSLMMVLQRIRRELLHHFIDASIRSFTDLKIKVKWATFWHHQTAFASQLAHLLLYVGTHVRLKHQNCNKQKYQTFFLHIQPGFTTSKLVKQRKHRQQESFSNVFMKKRKTHLRILTSVKAS